MACIRARLRAIASLDEILKRQPVPQSLQALAEAYDAKRMAMAAAYGSSAYTLQAIAHTSASTSARSIGRSTVRRGGIRCKIDACIQDLTLQHTDQVKGRHHDYENRGV